MDEARLAETRMAKEVAERAVRQLTDRLAKAEQERDEARAKLAALTDAADAVRDYIDGATLTEMQRFTAAIGAAKGAT